MRGFDKFYRRTRTHISFPSVFSLHCAIYTFHQIFISIQFSFVFALSRRVPPFSSKFFLSFCFILCVFFGQYIVSEKCIAHYFSIVSFSAVTADFCASKLVRELFTYCELLSIQTLFSFLFSPLFSRKKRKEEKNTMNVWCTRYFSFNCRFDL